MSNANKYNYEKIDRPYNSLLNRGSVSNPNIFSNPQNNQNSAVVDNNLVINQGNLSNIWIKNWIKSKSYQPEVRGFLIDGIKGYLECADANIIGTLTADKLNIGGGAEITVDSDTNLNKALYEIAEAGGGKLNLSPGIYKPGANLFAYDNTYIEGTSSGNTIIDFESADYGIIWLGTNVHTTGTITSITGGVAVLGNATAWTVSMIGRQMLLNKRWHKIIAVADATHLTLETGYADGATYSGAYRIANPINNISLRGVTIKNSTTTALQGTDIRDVGTSDLVFVSNNKGFVFTHFMNVGVTTTVVATSTSNGYELTDGSFFNAISGLAASTNGGSGGVLNAVKSSTILYSASNSNTAAGFNLTDVTNCLLKVEAASNGAWGVNMVSGCDFVFINDSLINANTTGGILLTATCDNNTIGPNLNVTNHDTGGEFGISIADNTSLNNFVLAPMYSNNDTDMDDNGTGTAFLTPA